MTKTVKRKKKWLLICLLLVALLALCYSCGLFDKQKYECDVSTVKSIQIVQLEKAEQGEEKYEYTVLATISDHAAFFDKLNNVKQSTNGGAPQMFFPPCVVIRIEFQNGDVDLLTDYAQEKIRSDVTHCGYIVFNEKQFAELIYSYYPYYYSTPESVPVPSLPDHKK